MSTKKEKRQSKSLSKELSTSTLESQPQTDTELKKNRSKRLFFFKQEEIQNICTNNGISEQAFLSKLNTISSLEMCHFNFPNIPQQISIFKNLKLLTIVAQDLSEVGKNLDELICLEKLWICETRISVMEGFNNLVNLKELYLYGNKITKIQNLENNVDLEILSLSDNQIKNIENLQTLVKLKIFQCGNNLISKIGHSFDKNVEIRELMLSGNLISNFREIIQLVHLPNLKSLSLSNPNFRENPISSLFNYQTHVILHLPQLKYLDTLEITEESRKMIGATVLKKIMYYNMRIKTIKRNESLLSNSLKIQYSALESQIEEDVQILINLSKRIQRRFDDYTISPINNFSTAFKTNLEDIKSRISVLLNFNQRKLQSLQKKKKKVFNQIENQGDSAIRKLLLELETGGNIRFEDEQNTDNWMGVCEDIIKSVINRSFNENPSSQILVHRISKIHNRHLKFQYESNLKKFPEQDQNKFIHLIFQPSKDDDLFDIIENGLEKYYTQKKYKSHKLLLRNYLTSENQQKHCNTEDSNTGRKESSSSVSELKQVLIVKVLVSKVTKVPTLQLLTDYNKPQNNSSGIGVEFTSENKTSPDFIYKDNCQIYHSFSADSILPEFLMEYTEDDLLNTNFSSISEITLEPKILEIARSCHLAQPFMTISSRRIEREIHRVDTQVSELMSELQKYTEIKSNVFPTIAFTMGLLLRKSINTIETLNLSFCQPKVENQEQTKTLNTKLNPTTSFLNDFSTFTNLKHLYISNTDIYNEKMLENLKNFSLLETLDLSFNFLQYLPKSLKYLTKLKVLNLMGNKLDIDMYFDFFPKNSENTKNENNAVEFWFNSLTNLDLRFNLICSRKNYDTIFISKLKNLKLFNGVEIKEENKPVKINYEKLLIERSSCQKYIFRPLSVRTHRGFGSTTSFHEYWDPKSKRMQIYLCDSSPLNQEKYFTTPNADKIRHITTLELDNCNLFDLKLLPDGMVNLRWASFKNNNLREIDKLENFQGLEELCLEGNEIEHLECLIKLPNLARLDASNNRVANIVAAASFKSLVFLSLEGNRIKSLKEFAHNHTLMELYVANNEIKDLFSIFPLKEIQRLIILDLTGNEITKCKDYRLFLIFHLSKLKILDGGSISTKEQQSAKDLLFGRLTVELLGEKIGHFSFKNILELDLRNFKIKEIDCFKPLTFEKKPSSGLDEFRNLKRINFDNNCLTNIDSLTRLRGLKYLSLNGNKIERLLVTDSPGYFNKNIESDTKVTPEYNLSYILFPNLEELYLGNNLISKISDLGLGRIPNLRYLNLNGNKITKLDGLEHLTSLISLVLDKNHIKSAEPSSFLSLVNLRDLHLRENRIKTLCHFDCLPNLQKIFLQGNRIQEISELEKFKLPNLQEISLTGNSVSRRQIFRVTLIMRCPNLLVIDGKDVTEEERLRVEGFLSEQNQLKEDVAKILPPPLLNQSMNSIVKLPIKIKSVVLDGLEMKLSSNNSGFGSSNRMN